MKLIEAIIDAPLIFIIIFLTILFSIVGYNEYLIQEGFKSDTVIKLEPGYRVINMNEKASQDTNYVIIHTKNVKNDDDVLITYRIENKTKKVELVHKIIVKEDN